MRPVPGSLALAVLLLSALGCAPYGARMASVLDALGQADYARALAGLDSRPQPRSVLWQEERGLLLRYVGRLEESNRAFAEALALQEDLYTRSVSNEAVSLAVSDALRPYRAPDYETPFLHLYPMLNYLELDDPENAAVEARALSRVLEDRRAVREDPSDDWGPGRLMAGLCLEASGESNDAWIAYRAAEAAFETQPCPAELLQVVREGIERTGEPSDSGAGPKAEPSGRVVVWVESGLLPLKQDVHLRVPIFKDEENWDPNRPDSWDRALGERTMRVFSGQPDFSGGKVAYLLDVALPVLPPPAPPPVCRLDLVCRPADPAGSGGISPKKGFADVPVAIDLDQIQRDQLARDYPVIAARAAARALLKGLATRSARRKSGELAGSIANLLGVATERTDTRSWVSLPARIGIVVLDLPPGEVSVTAVAGNRDPEGASGSFRLPSGGWHFYTCRVFP